jgi:hypothetical protein
MPGEQWVNSTCFGASFFAGTAFDLLEKPWKQREDIYISSAGSSLSSHLLMYVEMHLMTTVLHYVPLLCSPLHLVHPWTAALPSLPF